MLVHTKGRARAFAHATSGTVSIMFAVMSVVMLGTAALAIDYNAWTNQQSEMQSIGDAAALVGAKQLAVTGVSAEAKSASEAFLASKNRAAGTFLVTVAKDTGKVTISQTALGHIYLVGTLGVKNPNIQVFSEATAAKPARPCIIALEPTAPIGIDFSLAGSVTAIDCAIWSNSTSATSFDVNGSGTGSSSQNCAVGGVSGSSFAITPSVQAGCQPAADPYESWSPPNSSTCDYTDLDKLSAGAVTLTPGVYCGGLRIGGTSAVTLEPGIYIFKDGPLKVNAGASLIGNGVTIILTGANSSADFLAHATLHLSAPTSGPTEGLVIAAGRGEPILASKVGGGAELDIEGTVYLPTHDLSYGGNSESAMPSSYSMLIARTITFHGGSTVIVRGDPETSTVPMKSAVVPGNVRLTR